MKLTRTICLKIIVFFQFLSLVAFAEAPVCAAVFDSEIFGRTVWIQNPRSAPKLFPSTPHLQFSDFNVKVVGDLSSGKTPLVLIHGANSSMETFLPQAQNFYKDRAVVLYDMRGSGNTKEPGAGYDLNVMADDLLVVLDGLKIQKAVLHGHSAGGSTALLFAALHPSRVKALSLEDVSGLPYKARHDLNMYDTSSTIQFLRSMKSSYSSIENLVADASLILKGRPAQTTDHLLKKSRRGTTFSPHKAASIEELMLDVGTRDLSEAYTQYNGPILIMKAEYTSRYLSEEHIKRIQILRPNAEMVVMTQSGHSIHNDNPVLWERALKEFVERVAP
ncbi:hypothetical protein AZI86_01130 [Bdellovibrio bacteriovorus]|uniref:AB hydrolase-1 domain-containing protein n=1 Tax=Bdellovibrio bacteriovorus TaxID=959 RepID=A0A150WN39_BDEBC|nr:alpha/beta hydrolase [Bdellovibrio bacteriovorus]KYG65709.1 hypothetical protein AZI86_01130 [Bdellovibrio bacteriovorus]